MILDRVTMTGADNSVSPGLLAELSQQYPYVEWGILVSPKRTGTPRFPDAVWMYSLQRLAETTPMQLALHVCGNWVPYLLMGHVDFPASLLHGFQHVQLNFHGQEYPCQALPFWQALSHAFPSKQIIFQIDGQLGQRYLELALAQNRPGDPYLSSPVLDCVPLFDMSHGAGVLPAVWPKPILPGYYHGYAGGLGPDTLPTALPLIAAAAGEARIWVDMETQIRSEDDAVFNAIKVVQVLDFLAPHIHRL